MSAHGVCGHCDAQEAEITRLRAELDATKAALARAVEALTAIWKRFKPQPAPNNEPFRLRCKVCGKSKAHTPRCPYGLVTQFLSDPTAQDALKWLRGRENAAAERMRERCAVVLRDSFGEPFEGTKVVAAIRALDLEGE